MPQATAPFSERTDPKIPVVIGGYQMPAEIEKIVEPDGVADDVRWESVAFISVHHRILPIFTI